MASGRVGPGRIPGSLPRRHSHGDNCVAERDRATTCLLFCRSQIANASRVPLCARVFHFNFIPLTSTPPYPPTPPAPSPLLPGSAHAPLFAVWIHRRIRIHLNGAPHVDVGRLGGPVARARPHGAASGSWNGRGHCARAALQDRLLVGSATRCCRDPCLPSRVFRSRFRVWSGGDGHGVAEMRRGICVRRCCVRVWRGACGPSSEVSGYFFLCPHDRYLDVSVGLRFLRFVSVSGIWRSARHCVSTQIVGCVRCCAGDLRLVVAQECSLSVFRIVGVLC